MHLNRLRRTGAQESANICGGLPRENGISYQFFWILESSKNQIKAEFKPAVSPPRSS